MPDKSEPRHVKVFKDFMEKTIKPTYSADVMSSDNMIRGAFTWNGRLMVCIGGLIESGQSWTKAEAYDLTPLAAYKGTPEPLEHDDHWNAVGRGERERCYSGMLVSHGKEKVVLGEEVVFVALPETEQQDLFS